MQVKMRMGIDVAATELWNGEAYVYRDRKLTQEEQISYIAELVDHYDLLYVEDPLHENDFDGFAELTKQVNCMICGDDIFVTNVKRIVKGIELGAANTVLIKPNQIGTLTETFKAVKLAKDNGYGVVVSHRSGESEDETIAHLAIAFNAKLIKTGVVGGERIAKLNELIRIEEFMDKPRMVVL
jgi:enolase